MKSYDYLSLAIEDIFWRAVGFAGGLIFSRRCTSSALVAEVVGAPYFGSGVVSWESLGSSAVNGKMFAPRVLASGSLAIRASPLSGGLRSASVSGVDLVGMLLPNPSFFPGMSSAMLNAPYSCDVPSITVLVGQLGTRTR